MIAPAPVAHLGVDAPTAAHPETAALVSLLGTDTMTPAAARMTVDPAAVLETVPDQGTPHGTATDHVTPPETAKATTTRRGTATTNVTSPVTDTTDASQPLIAPTTPGLLPETAAVTLTLAGRSTMEDTHHTAALATPKIEQMISISTNTRVIPIQKTSNLVRPRGNERPFCQ